MDRAGIAIFAHRYLAVKLVILAAALVAFFLPFGEGLGEDNFIYRQPDPASLADRFSPFDGQWYRQIAEQGYRAQPLYVQQRNINFFPLYPMLLHAFAPAFGSAAVAGIAVSLVAGAVAAFFLAALVAADYPLAVAQRTVWYLLVFPSAVVLSAVYSEALFLALGIGALYAGRRRRWGWAALLGVFAALTRSVGGLIILPLVVQYARASGFRWRAWLRGVVVYAVIPISVAGYLAFSGWLAGDWLIYPKALRAGWEHQFGFPWAAFAGLGSRELFGYRDGALDAVVGGAFALLLLPIARRLQPEYTAFAAAFTLVPLYTGSTMSWTRYMMVSFPHFLYLAQQPWLQRRWPALILSSLLLGGLIAFTLRFTSWQWIG